MGSLLNMQFTPASERALAEAARWSRGAPGGGVDLPALLMGLLAEPECRAALLLAARGVDVEAVRRRWPELAREDIGEEAALGDAPAVWGALQAAQAWLGRRSPGDAWATEHLLLGIVAAEGETAAWLVEAGFSAEALAGEIGRRGDAAGKVGLAPQPAEEGVGELALDTSLEGRSERERGEDDTAPTQRLVGLPAHPTAALRVLDAAGNRAREGLRVVEDYARFVLDDRHLTELLKTLRHELAGAFALLPGDRLVAMRETQADVGTTLSTDGERRRGDFDSVVVSNFKRVQEALRSLEEFGKLVSAEFGGRIEQLRYWAYTIEKALLTTARAVERLAGARLYVLVDGRDSAEQFEKLVASLVAAGVDVLQLRDKRLADRELLERARILRRVTAGTATLFVMNDRADLARLAEADGVHVGQDELGVKDARSIVGPRVLVGVSTHSIEQARQAVLDGADYIGVGPTFPSTTKSFAEFTGLELLRAVAAEIRLPAFAIGGIGLANLGRVLETGMTRVAVSGAIGKAEKPVEVVQRFKSGLNAEPTR